VAGKIADTLRVILMEPEEPIALEHWATSFMGEPACFELVAENLRGRGFESVKVWSIDEFIDAGRPGGESDA
jgi:hypothetical protein